MLFCPPVKLLSAPDLRSKEALSCPGGGRQAAGGAVGGVQIPHTSLYWAQLRSQLPVATALAHLLGHVLTVVVVVGGGGGGGAGVYLGRHSPQMSLYWLQLGSQFPEAIAFSHFLGHSRTVVVVVGAGVEQMGKHSPQMSMQASQLESQFPDLMASQNWGKIRMALKILQKSNSIDANNFVSTSNDSCMI